MRHFMFYQVEARSRQEILFRYLALETTDVVLDVGCGTGYFTNLMWDKAARVVGVDMDLASVRVAKKFSPKQDFILSDATKLPIKSQAVTKILCSEVLEHVSDDMGLTNECCRVLRDGGVMVCSSINASFPFHSRKSSHTKAGSEFHIRVGYSVASLCQLLSRAGFGSIQISSALPMLGTLVVEVLERTYSALYQPLRSQSELARLDHNRILKLYKLFFPFLLRAVRVTFPKSLGGSILVAKALRPKFVHQ